MRSSWEWVVDMGKKNAKVKILEWTNIKDWEKTKELDGPMMLEENQANVVTEKLILNKKNAFRRNTLTKYTKWHWEFKDSAV